MILQHLHLYHGDFVRVKVTATNGALVEASATSDGFTVDLTEPRMMRLVDGANIAHDLEYTVSVTLSLSIYTTCAGLCVFYIKVVLYR